MTLDDSVADYAMEKSCYVLFYDCVGLELDPGGPMFVPCRVLMGPHTYMYIFPLFISLYNVINRSIESRCYKRGS